METQSGYFSRGSARLYYEVTGVSQPIVLLHAGVADSRQWNNEFGSLARRYCVLRYDLRGYGKTEPLAGEFSHLADLLALLDYLRFDAPVVLIGCSMGGVLAMDFALEHPARAKALVMVGSYPSRLRLETPDHPNVAQAIAANEAGDLDLLAELEAQIWFDGMGRTPRQVDQAMRKLMLDMNRIALTNEARHLGRRLPDTAVPAAERLAELHIPVLVVTGDQDIPYIQAAADYMVEHIPSVQRAIIADAAHLPNMDHPGRFLEVIAAFLIVWQPKSEVVPVCGNWISDREQDSWVGNVLPLRYNASYCPPMYRRQPNSSQHPCLWPPTPLPLVNSSSSTSPAPACRRPS